MQLPSELRCTEHAEPLNIVGATRVEDSGALVCPRGCQIPVVNKIPRFVNESNYASGFGLQWNAFKKTQLDSATGTTISKDRLARCLGNSVDALRDRSVLEVGCGAGRFTELMLAAGARVFACDLSMAVEANYDNCHHWPNYFVCQADASRLPVARHAFDYVVCLGVIQHTPDSEATIAALARNLRPGGTLVIDHYGLDYPQNFMQRTLRWVLIRLPPRVAKSLAIALARALLPVHRLTWKNRRGIWRLRRLLLKHSPLIDYKDAYSQLDARLLSEWAILDTHDTLTDRYKHLRSKEQIQNALQSCGLTDIEVCCDGNGVEARARMPAKTAAVG